MDANDWLDDLPAVPVNLGGRPVTSKTNRQVKVSCAECGFVAWTTRASLERGRPECCGAPLGLPRLEDRAAVEWDALERDLELQGRDAYLTAMRELGARDLMPRAEKFGRAGVQKTCEASGCHKFTAGRYCPEHRDERPSMGAAFKR